MIDLHKYAGHTPGPWGYCGSLGPQSNQHLMGPHVVESGSGRQIAIMSGWRSDLTEANARLIADAPALLDEVKRLRWLLEQYGHDPDLRFAVEGW